MIVKLAMLGTVVLVEITQHRGVTNVFFVFVIQPFLFFYREVENNNRGLAL